MPELLEEIKEEKQDIYKPSDSDQDIISAVWSKWQVADDQRQQSYRYFNDRSLVEYVGDSVDRFNGYIEPRVDPASDWGAKVFNNVTRNKTVAIIAQITAERVRSEFFAQNMEDEDDQRTAELIKHVEDYSYYKNKDDEQQFYGTLEATVKGTVIGYEGYKLNSRKIKEVEEYNPDTGELKWTEKTIYDWDDVYGEVVPLLEFYPGNIWEREMQKQPFVIWRTIYDKDVFDLEFGKYKNASKVVASQEYYAIQNGQVAQGETSTDGTSTFYMSEGLEDNKVEVVRYFNKWADEMRIIANGVLLTTGKHSPLPWDHKDYPFWKTIFEPFASDFFYGKSLPDKLKSNQDVLNVLYRMLIDQGMLSINPPMLTTGMESIKDELLWPGRRMIVDDTTQTKAMEIPAPGQAHFNIIAMVEANLNKSAIDDTSSGIAGARSRTTAFEVGIANDAAKKLLSLFLRTLEYGVRDKTELRVANILQFYRLPKVKDLTSEEDSLDYRRVILDDVELVDGTKGRQVVQFVDSQDKLPSREDVTKAELYYLHRGQNIAFSFITTDKLKKIDLKIKIIPNSSVKMSEAMERVTELDYQKNANTFYPDLLNREEAFKEFTRVFGKNPTKMMVQQGAVNPAVAGQTPAGGVQPNETPASGPSMSSPNSMAAAGVPNATSAGNSMRNMAAQ